MACVPLETPPGKAYFWCGDTYRPGTDIVEHSAMSLAQNAAKRGNGATVELTPGGNELHHYCGFSNSFSAILKRFSYLAPMTTDTPETLRKDIAIAKLLKNGISIDATLTSILNSPNNSSAGALWNIISRRFAQQATGTVHLIHAVNHDSEYFSSEAYQNNTWQNIERPALRENPNVTIKTHYLEEILKAQIKSLPL